MIRVLHISGLNRLSGGDSIMMNYYRNIDKSKVQFDFMYFKGTALDYANEVEESGGKYFLITKPTIKTWKSTQKELDDFFSENAKNYDIIHSSTLTLSRMVFKTARKYSNPICISHSHNSKLSEHFLKHIRNKLTIARNLTGISDYLFACSEYAGMKIYGKNVTKKDNYKTIHNAIHTEKFKFNSSIREKMRKELGIEDKFTVGHVGRFVLQKNHEFLIDIFCEILKKDPNSVLLLLGRGENEGIIKDKVNRLGLNEHVKFLGGRDNINEYLQAMDVFLLPSFFEGLPIVLIEAQTSGLKCFASDEITKESNVADLVEFYPLKKSASFWAESILKDKTRNRETAFDKVLQAGYDMQTEAKKLEELYASLLKTKEK